MRKQVTILVFPLVLLLALNLTAQKINYKDWLNKEVNLIITKSEKDAFKKLKKDKDKEQFIKLFWAKRDPTPQTEKNEFKEEYYRRLSFLNTEKPFRYEYKTGLETDQGKVYLFFGQAKVFPQGDYEIWVYSVPPWIKDYPKETISFTFKRVSAGSAMAAGGNIAGKDQTARNTISQTSLDQVGFVFDRDQTDTRVMQAFYDYPKALLLYPNLTELPEYKEILSFASDSLEAELINRIDSSGEEILAIPFTQDALIVKAANLSSHLTFLLRISPSAGEAGFKHNKIVVFGRFYSEAYSTDFKRSLDLKKENETYAAQLGLPLFPGEYNCYLGIYTPDKKLYSLKKSRMTVPDLWKNDLAVSSLLISPEVMESTARSPKGEFNVFRVGKYLLTPHPSREFNKSQFLNLFYYIYNASVDEAGNCSLSIQYELRKGGRNFKMNPQKRQQPLQPGDPVVDGTRIPLSALPDTGEYELVVMVKDDISQASVTQSVKFTLLEKSP